MFTLLAGLLFAQCADPPVPSGGFPIRSSLANLVTYTDAYRTRADVYFPDAAPGPCGWPLVVDVHELSGSRASALAYQTLTPAGYAVVAYDVRGQGDARSLNPSGRGATLVGLTEKIDVAEIVEWARAAFPGQIDPARVAITGFSQGGIHAWSMAAWSGLVPPPNPRRSAPFPTFAAAVPRGFTGEPIPALFPESTVLHGVAVAAFLVGLPTFVLDDAFKLPVVGYIQSGDFSGLQAFLDADPGRSNLAGLRSTSVPILFMASTHDYWNDPNWGLDLLRELPPFTPKRAVLTTGGHDTVINAYEDLAQQRLTRRWFDRFVKGAQNGVELEPATVASARPFDTAGYNDPAALWPHRLDGPWPAADVTNRRWYLRAAGGLDPAPPAASEAADRVRHQVPANYSLNTFSIALFLPSLFFLSLPLSSFPYTTAPLAADLEIAGRARARLEVTPTGPDFALHAALYAVSAGGTETWLADGIRGVRGGMPVPQTLEIDLAAIDVVVPAGQRLRLRVENHAWFKPPGQNIIRFAPMLRSVDVFVTKEPAAPSQVDVPVRASVRPGLTTRTDSIPLGAPPRVDLFVEARGRAGAAYAVAFSLSGIVPGIVLPGGTLPLVPDGLFLASLGAANSPLFPGTQGALDANGRATAGLALGTLGPLDPSLVGLRISAAAAVFPPGTAEPTNAVDLFLR